MDGFDDENDWGDDYGINEVKQPGILSGNAVSGQGLLDEIAELGIDLDDVVD